ncbi:MAG: VOC family protein [Thermoplasmata archaeon]
MGLVYVGLRVTDLDRSRRFYTEGLGLVAGAPGRMSHGGTYVSLKDPGTGAQLELNYYPPGNRFATPFAAGEGLDHLGFDVTDARATIARLRAMGAKVAVEPWLEQGRYWIGFVEDPNGLWIEVQSPVPGGTGDPTGPSAPS